MPTNDEMWGVSEMIKAGVNDLNDPLNKWPWEDFALQNDVGGLNV